MKRVLSILMLCSILVTITVGTAMAGDPEYSILEHMVTTTKTIDGVWSPNDEWFDGLVIAMGDDCNYTYNLESGVLRPNLLIEFFSDDTDDTEDYWEICLDSTNLGGTAPSATQYKIRIDGHTTLTCYEGNGQDWDVITPDAGELNWSNSITGTPRDSNDHWILEFRFNKATGAIQTGQPPNGMRIAAYDADTDTLAAWPPDSDADVPDEWGVISNFSQDPIPEGFTFAVMVFLSSIALLVGSHYLQKRSKKQKQ